MVLCYNCQFMIMSIYGHMYWQSRIFGAKAYYIMIDKCVIIVLIVKAYMHFTRNNDENPCLVAFNKQVKHINFVAFKMQVG